VKATDLYDKIQSALGAGLRVLVFVPCPWLAGYIRADHADTLMLLRGRRQTIVNASVDEGEKHLYVTVDA
jgi:hypothetical protein